MCSRDRRAPGTLVAVPLSRLIDQWESGLPGLTDQGVRGRLALATKNAADSLGARGRNPKAARMWREKAEADAELERRGLAR